MSLHYRDTKCSTLLFISVFSSRIFKCLMLTDLLSLCVTAQFVVLWWDYNRTEHQILRLTSSGKESVCNAGDPGLIPGSGRASGEGIGYPLQYSWSSLLAQQVKNPPAMQETWVRSLGGEDTLEKGKGTHSSILAWGIPCTIVHGVTKSQTLLSDYHFLVETLGNNQTFKGIYTHKMLKTVPGKE